MRLTTAFLLLMLPATAAQAQVMLSTSGGPGQACYLAAKFDTQRDALKTCDMALDQPLSVNDRAATYNNRGIVLTRQGQFSRARSDFTNAMRLRPDLGDAYVNYGSILIRDQRYEDALEQINKGMALSPYQPHIAYYDRAVALQLLGRYREAYFDYKKALELEPSFTLAAERLKDFVVQRAPATN